MFRGKVKQHAVKLCTAGANKSSDHGSNSSTGVCDTQLNILWAHWLQLLYIPTLPAWLPKPALNPGVDLLLGQVKLLWVTSKSWPGCCRGDWPGYCGKRVSFNRRQLGAWDLEDGRWGQSAENEAKGNCKSSRFCVILRRKGKTCNIFFGC